MPHSFLARFAKDSSRRPRWGLALILMLCPVLALGLQGCGGNLPPTSDCTVQGLQNLIMQNPSGVTIPFAKDCTVAFSLATGSLMIKTPVTLNGNGHTVIFSGQGQERPLVICPLGCGQTTVTLENLIFQDGSAPGQANGGAIIINGGKVNIVNCMFKNNNVGQGDGGAIDNVAGNVTLSNNTNFTMNSATHGGAIVNQGGFLNIQGGTFDHNVDSPGGAGGAGGAIATTGGAVNITGGAAFTNNTSANDGALRSGRFRDHPERQLHEQHRFR